MTWRMYAQRTVTGDWLDTNVAAGGDLTWSLSAPGDAKLAIPAAYDQTLASDGHPLWIERGTTLYVEEDDRLAWVGLCSFQKPTKSGRELEFKGLSSAYDLIGFDGNIREWEPDPFDIVRRLIGNANGQPDGDMGFQVIEDGKAGDKAGDEKPPSDRPGDVKRQRGETSTDFDKRKADRAKSQQAWDEQYGDREPYTVAWWESPYIAEEIAELATETPFDWLERHEWADRAALERRSELVLSPRAGRERPDLALIEGLNLADMPDPVTDFDNYGNHVVLLGAGEGRKMRLASIGSRDMRIRTTRFREAKHVHNPARLRARARRQFARMTIAVKLDQAASRGPLGGLQVGDTVPVQSRLFDGWCRVHGITRNTRTGNVTFNFTETKDQT